MLVVFAANVFLDRPHVDALLFAIALAVGISPELLPAIISVTLARGAREMARQGVIVRRLNAIENFGSMDVLCSDKTGTLTEGTIRLEAVLDAQGADAPHVLAAAAVNARLQTGMRNPLDEAILARAGQEQPVPRKLDEIPYDFVRRRVTVVVEEGDHARFLTKGALAELLEVCASVRDGAEPVPLTASRKAALEARMAAGAPPGCGCWGWPRVRRRTRRTTRGMRNRG